MNLRFSGTARLFRLPGLALMLALVSGGALRAADEDKPAPLSPFFVRETRISDFGLSIVTNFGVVWGGQIKWMKVGEVMPGTAAALASLHPGDEIFMIDGQPRSGMSRDTMLKIFFQRQSGELVSLEVRDVRTRLLRLVRLRAR